MKHWKSVFYTMLFAAICATVSCAVRNKQIEQAPSQLSPIIYLPPPAPASYSPAPTVQQQRRIAIKDSLINAFRNIANNQKLCLDNDRRLEIKVDSLTAGLRYSTLWERRLVDMVNDLYVKMDDLDQSVKSNRTGQVNAKIRSDAVSWDQFVKITLDINKYFKWLLIIIVGLQLLALIFTATKRINIS